MTKFTLSFACILLLLFGCKNQEQKCEPQARNKALESIDSMAVKLKWPDDLLITGFAGPDLTPSPACLAVAATGEVFVGVDMIGSLGKTPGKGMIVRLVDCNNDGILDSHTEFAQVDNPRGIISLGDKLFVLHTMFADDSTASEMDLVVFTDKDHDGIADGPSKTLISHMSNIPYLKSRGTDHATNGIRMGIDGWIYIAVGDYSFHEAVGSDGKKLTMLGGGIVRVRPDGTEMEMYTHGLRNIYDVAIDPYMNIFTRDNTNDGGGWNIRFSHQIQSGEYGYPILFQHFTEEILPALVDLGGGSGTGSLFMDEPTWPDKYNHIPMMADWGKNELYIHRLTPDGATFTQQQEDFIHLPQITDLDVDGSGRLYLSAWDGAGYSGDSSKGFIARAIPKNWEYRAFPNLKEASISELQSLLKSNSAVARLNSQEELLTRHGKKASEAAWALASDKSVPLYARIAAMYTYSQIEGANGIKNIASLTSEESMKEFALRALTDRQSLLKDAPIEPFLKAVKDSSKRVQVAAIIGLGRLGRMEAADALLQVPVPNSFAPVPKGQEGPHATPNAAIVPAHVAMQALVKLNAIDACLTGLNTEHSTLALWTLRYMHDPKAVDGLIAFYNQSKDEAMKKNVLSTLARLYKEEAPYDGSWWWGTRPDSHGPYYKDITWGSSDKIRDLLMAEWKKTPKAEKQFFAGLNGKYRLDIDEFGGNDELVAENDDGGKVDFNKIKSEKGQIGKSSIENVMIALDKIKGNPAIGKKLFTQQGCFVCHSISKGETMKGPFMGQIGSIMTRQQIAESILKPNASISQGFSTVNVTTKNGKTISGFVTAQSADKLVLRDITGKATSFKTSDIVKREELKTSIMPTGLANSLSYEEFASLVTFLSQQK